MKYLNFNNLSQRPTKFYRFTGLEVGEFLILKEEIEPLWQESEIKRLFHANRQRAIGSGRKYHLRSLEDKMLLVFFFYRLFILIEVIKELKKIIPILSFSFLKKLIDGTN